MKRKLLVIAFAGFLFLHPFQNVRASQSESTSSVFATVESEGNMQYESTVVFGQEVTDSSNANEQLIENETFTGWESILQYMEEHADISEISIQLEDDTIVPKEVWDIVGQRSIKIVLYLSNGFYWTVNGENIDLEETQDTDMGVEANASNISTELIESIPGDASYVQIHLNHEGIFGFTAECTFMIKEDFSGYTSKLYYYNTETEELDLTGENQILEDGTTSFSFSHASDYVMYFYQQNSEIEADDNQIVNFVQSNKQVISIALIFTTFIVLITGLLKKTAIGIYLIQRKAGGKIEKDSKKQD